MIKICLNLGTGLMEIVTEPDFSNGMDAAAFVKEMQLILERINTCNCKMEGTGYIWLCWEVMIYW